MITDEQGRKWLMQKLYDDGWRYCVMDNYENVFLTNEKPAMYDDVDEIRISSCYRYRDVTVIGVVLPELERNECISIAEELGIVDWSKVPVDTPVRVWNNESTTKERRHFAGYENGYVLTWSHGGTSWSSPKHCVSEWDHAELVEL